MTQSLEGDFNPAVHFLGLLKKAISDGIARRCSMTDGPQIVISPRQMTYYSASISPAELRALCLAQPFDLQIEALPNWSPEGGQETIQVGRMRMRTQSANALAGLASKPLGELLWLAAVSASNGRLLQGCRADEPVRLKQWPDLALLKHHGGYLQLAQFMQANSADLLTVAKRTGVPLSDVYEFHNACAMLGLVERGNLFEAGEYFLGLIQQSLRDGLVRRCALPGQPPVYLAPRERRYYWQPGSEAQLAAFYSASLSDMQIDVVERVAPPADEEETIQVGRLLMRRKKENAAPRLACGPLDDFIWNAALRASRGRLLAGARGQDVVRLKRWPDFSRLAQDRRLLPLAAFMSVNAASLPTVARHTGTPLPQVFDFHNACAALDYLEYLPEERLLKKPVSDQERKTYRSISRSLGGIRAAEHAG